MSFGTAFFGLERLALSSRVNKSETQAKELEATIQRLNKAQTQGLANCSVGRADAEDGAVCGVPITV